MPMQQNELAQTKLHTPTNTSISMCDDIHEEECANQSAQHVVAQHPCARLSRSMQLRGSATSKLRSALQHTRDPCHAPPPAELHLFGLGARSRSSRPQHSRPGMADSTRSYTAWRARKRCHCCLFAPRVVLMSSDHGVAELEREGHKVRAAARGGSHLRNLCFGAHR